MTLFFVVVLFRFIFINCQFLRTALFFNFSCYSCAFHEWNANFSGISTYE
ncbi:50S ribosomal protein L21 [Listeria monocytogenes]|nr:50S ribosomal protein L21 [Listeria monocytogenes]GAT41172.1 50S ribosomal protein L21 [Listeria monocytogenes]